MPETLAETATFFGFDSLLPDLGSGPAAEIMAETLAEAQGDRLLSIADACPVSVRLECRDATLELDALLPQVADLLRAEVGSAAVLDELLASKHWSDDRGVAARALMIASHRWPGHDTLQPC